MEVSVAVEPGDRVMAQMIQDRIAEKLGTGGGAAKTGFVSGSRVEGVYDYFCQPHEAAGMIGRIVVGAPGKGPGTQPFGYASGKGWKPVPAAAQKQFPAIDEIMRRGMVRRA